MTPAERALIRDTRLTPAARALGMWFASHTPAFVETLTEARIVELYGAGRAAVRQAIAALVDVGYLLTRRLRDAGGNLVRGLRYAFTLRPQPALPIDVPVVRKSHFRSDQAERGNAAGQDVAPVVRKSHDRSSYKRNYQEEHKELPAQTRDEAPQSSGGTMPRTRKPTPGQTVLWPAIIPTSMTSAVQAAMDAQEQTLKAQAVGEDHAGVILGEWLERCPVRPPGRVVGQVGKLVREMLQEGVPGDAIRRGMASWMGKGLHPAALPAEVNAVANRHAGALYARRSTTDERVNATLQLAEQLDRAHLRAVGS